jgi:16S rRNA processing protein RimM
MTEGRKGKDKTRLVVMGVITSAHGIRGEVKIRSFTEVPEDIAAYGPLLIEDGPREVEILRLRPGKGGLIARLKGVEDRNAAELLKGRKLKLPRSRLPEPEEEDAFYYDDLVGLRAERADGSAAGEVVAVHDFGAGDLLEIRPPDSHATYFLPFTREMVPEIDISGGRIVINPPEELEGPALGAARRGRHKRRRMRKEQARQEQKRRGSEQPGGARAGQDDSVADNDGPAR